MLLNMGPSSSSNASQSFNNSSHPKDFKTMSGISQLPNPSVNNSNVASSSTATNDDHGGDLVLSSCMEKTLEEVREYFRELRTSHSKKELVKLKKTVDNFESQIQKMHKKHLEGHKFEDPWSDESNNGSNQAYVNEEVPSAELRNKGHKYFKDAAAVEDFFLRLPDKKRDSLLCLLKFPKNAIIKKRLIVYWWIGMGILSDSWTTEEDFGNQLFNEHIQRGFIKPVSLKRDSVVESCWIPTLVHSTLTDLAKRTEFRQHGNDECKEFLSGPNFGSATLYSTLTVLERPEQHGKESKESDNPLEVSIREKATILHLGRWLSPASAHHIEVASAHHIEVESIKIFDGLKNKKLRLTFLSLRGISLITELPEFISELDDLKILDLRACHNLESLPDGISLLQKLTHLDMSECYFLEHMPKALASLQKLEVLKGFFIGKTDNNNCTLRDLARLQKLRKLNIYTSVKGFPTDNELKDLCTFPVLRKLTISWGGCSFGKTVTSSEPKSSEEPLPSMLKKLDLQCYPWTSAPNWLKIQPPSSLEKLYIRGGHLRDLPILSFVEKLRLKYLSELEMEWGQQRESFSNLNYLEIVKCPKVTGFTHEGVWMKNDNGTFQDTKLNKRSRILNVLHKVFR